jgi:hypothetical protein
MRFWIWISLLLVVVVNASRRGYHTIPAPPSRPKEVLMDWGYPYGWGLSVPDGEDGMGAPAELDMKRAKPVVSKYST